ncbi:Ltp family lipoprotein [Georgenia sp. EYE_87]|nr:Ltp family lipoprotein [Georgenia sp. EYE_87]
MHGDPRRQTKEFLVTQYPPPPGQPWRPPGEQQPVGQPWGPNPAGQQPHQRGGKAPRAWYKKKRFILPAGVAGLFVIIGIAGGAGADDEPTAVASPTTEVVDPAAEASASAAAEEAAKAEADKAAAEEAERVAAEKAAEEEAAEKAAAEEAARVEAEKAAAEQAAAEAAAAGTVAQQNAQRSAEDYLAFTAFSRTGLIGQLEFEGFSTADATWGVDHLTVDWNEQAAKSAEQYLEFTSFSHSGLVDQLIFEGFTAEQAEYGVSQTGL